MISETPVTALAATGLPSVIENASAATVMEAELVVPRLVVPSRSDTEAALALRAASTLAKLPAVTRYSWAAAL